MATSNNRVIDVNRFSLMVRWSTVLFPVEQSALVKLLPEKGFIVDEDITSRRASFGSRLEMTGVMGRKGSTALIVDAVRPGMSLDGNDPAVVIAEFDELENDLSNILWFNSQDHVRFYEIDAQALVSSKSKTLDAMRRYYGGSHLNTLVEEAIRHPVSQYAFRACSPKSDPHDIDWYELLFESSIRGAYSYFSVLTFRNPDRSIVWDIASRYEDILRRITDRIEGA